MSLMYSLFGWTGFVSHPQSVKEDQEDVVDEGFDWEPASPPSGVEEPLLAPGEGVGVKITPMESVGRGTGNEQLFPKDKDEGVA